MDTVIVPLDGSELSERALGLGRAFAQAYEARLALVHVLEEPIALDLLPSLAIPDRTVAEAYLRRVAGDVDGGADVSIHVMRGNPVDALIALSRDEAESMLVMSSHGRSGLGRLMFGSVADKVVRESSVPVALIHGSGQRYAGNLRSILVPLDGSLLSEEALPFAIDLARNRDATIHLVHICDPISATPYMLADVEQADEREEQMAGADREALVSGRSYLNRVVEYVQSQGIRVASDVHAGKPANEIVRVAGTTEADLIVMATHGRGGIRRLALGSVANEVLNRGTVPILAIPPRVAERQQYDAAEPPASI